MSKCFFLLLFLFLFLRKTYVDEIYKVGKNKRFYSFWLDTCSLTGEIVTRVLFFFVSRGRKTERSLGTKLVKVEREQ